MAKSYSKTRKCSQIMKTLNVDSTPEFICEDCGCHGDSCVCKAQRIFVAAKPTPAQTVMANGVAQFSFVTT